MKNFSRFGIAFLFFLTFFSLKSQEVDLLKNFINKNNIAIRSVQKNSIQISDPKNAENFKELLKLHVISIKVFESNKDVSSSAAYKLRQLSLDFLSKNTAGSIDYFKITEEETTKFGAIPSIQEPNSYLSESELKAIETINTKDPSLFNAFSTRIQ